MTSEYFLPGEWRPSLKRWLKDNCPSDRLQFVKAATGEDRLKEHLSLELFRRKAKHGMFSDIKNGLIEHEMKNCGKHGACEKHKKTGEQRFIGHYCNHRSFHLPCAVRYRNGQGIEMRSQFEEVAKKQNLWGFYSWVFTLPKSARDWIDNNPDLSPNFLKDVRRAVAKTIKACFGLNTKTRGVQPGFSILFHPVSSGNPFKQSAHFHALILPLLVNLHSKRIKKTEKRFDHQTVKDFYKKYLDKVLKKYGLADCVADKYVVNLRDVEIAHGSSVAHAFKYNNRSQVVDILKVIKRVKVDFSKVVCLLVDKKEGVLIPVIKTEKEILNALEYVLNPGIQIKMSYGFMRVLPQYAALLGVKLDEAETSDDWEWQYPVLIRRVGRSVYDLASKKVKRIVDVYVKRADSQEEWRKVKPDEVRGERAAMSKRKLYKAIV